MTTEEMERVAELEVRRYFDFYLNNTFPQQIKELQEHTRCQIEKHDRDRESHGGVELRFNRFFWILLGLAASGGAGAGTIINILMRVPGA